MTPQEELAALRRLAELEAKAGVSAPSQAPMAAPLQPSGNMPWADVASQAFQNIPASGKQFASDMLSIVTEPKETIRAVGNLGLGLIQKAIPGEQGSEKYADAVGQFMVDRYGGVENIKKTLATDPVGFAADISSVLAGGGALAARAPGMVGKAGRIAAEAGRLTDPLQVAGRSIAPVANAAGRGGAYLTGVLSGTGDAPIREAYSSGRAGGLSGETFRRNMRAGDNASQTLLADAQTGLDQLRRQKSEQYRSGMMDISKDKTVLDFDKIDDAFVKAFEANTYNGVPKSDAAANALSAIKSEIDAWREMDPKIFHTPEGIDALKMRVGDLMDWNNRGLKENQAIQSMYNSIKGVISEQAPVYSNVMDDYSKAATNIKEIERALSLGDKASADTSIRKLTSVMRNNVNTNFGERARMAEILQDASGTPILPGIAGQAMSSYAPRGLASLGTHAALTGTAGALLSPYALATIPMQSPRVVGEAAHALGRSSGAMTPAAAAVQQYGPRVGRASMYSGRLARELGGM